MSNRAKSVSKSMFTNPLLQNGVVVGVRLKSGDTFVGTFRGQNPHGCHIVPLGMRGPVEIPKNIIEILLVSVAG